MIDQTAPIALVYASEYSDCDLPVHLKVDDQDLIVIVQPGHDPNVMWKGLAGFLADEAIIP